MWAYRKKLNESFNVQTLPSEEFEGAYIPLRDMLTGDLCVLMDRLGVEDPDGQTFKNKNQWRWCEVLSDNKFFDVVIRFLETGQNVLTSAYFGHESRWRSVHVRVYV